MRTLTHADLSYWQQLRFWQRFKVGRGSDGCWEWQGGVDRHGYGDVRYERDQVVNHFQAHRLAYLLMVGPIPGGFELDHLCRNRVCGNPAHLEPVSHRENMLRGRGVGSTNIAKTQCLAGHPYDEANTYRDNRGRRGCRACNAAAQRRRMARLRETT